LLPIIAVPLSADRWQYVNTSSDDRIVGRFAPSPTGALHSGSLVAAVGSYLMAKYAGGQWLLRLDDLDRQRQLPGMADDIMRTLESFGLLWDGTVSRQSGHSEEYQHAFTLLQQNGSIYPCGCSRAEISRSASAPHGDDGIVYPGTCRDKMKKNTALIRSWRVVVPEEELCVTDLRTGCLCQSLSAVSGDFVVRRGDGEFAYQLAVVVDDHTTGVNQVVRGEDLLASTPRQIYLQRLLGFPQPVYCHLPLVTGPNGAKLSKRDNLVSQQLGTISGRKNTLLFAALRFLGQHPPAELTGASCTTLLEWGIAHFTPFRMSVKNGELMC
jgi:glutamyl-Q tRNA(Asp) synthetase